MVLGHRCSGVPRSGDDDQVAVGGSDVVAVDKHVFDLGVSADDLVAALHGAILRARTDDGFVPDTRETGSKTTSGGATAPDDSDTHGVSLAH